MPVPQMQSVMTPMPHAIEASASLLEAQQCMERHGVRHLPVLDRDQLVGLVSDRDLRRYLDPVLNMPAMRRVDAIMVRELYVVNADERLDRVLLRMVERRIGCVPVVDGARVVGIFTTTDATRMLGRMLRDDVSDGSGDASAG